jgi:hypothetical protein
MIFYLKELFNEKKIKPSLGNLIACLDNPKQVKTINNIITKLSKSVS